MKSIAMTGKDDVAPTSAATDPLIQLVDAINESMSVAQIEKAIHRMPISADAKVTIVALAKVGVQVGETLLRVGRMVVSFAIDLGRRFPNTTFGIVISAVVTTLIAFIPWVGPFLWPLLGPLLAAFGIYVGMTNDMRLSALKARESLLNKMETAEKSGLLERIEAFERRFQYMEDTLLDRGGATNAR